MNYTHQPLLFTLVLVERILSLAARPCGTTNPTHVICDPRHSQRTLRLRHNDKDMSLLQHNDGNTIKTPARPVHLSCSQPNNKQALDTKVMENLKKGRGEGGE